MAHRSPIVPTGKQRTEPISWPSEGKVSPAQPAEKAREAYRASVAAAERTLDDVQQKLSRTATSLVDAVHTFAKERPLHLIGIVAGASFVAGVALRISRSKRYA
jgi:ElaB/YqjD/DUF883 family membrane-anchored ribosome-binding protein